MSTSDAAGPADRSQRQYNFPAGPATLPVEALREVKDELPVYDHVGASVMEISHRSPAYDEIEASARPKSCTGAGCGRRAPQRRK